MLANKAKAGGGPVETLDDVMATPEVAVVERV